MGPSLLRGVGMPDIDALNDRNMLTNLPVGEAEVVMWCGAPALAIKNIFSHDLPPTIVHSMDDGSGVLDGLYGKAWWSQAQHRDLYTRHNDAVKARDERNTELHRRDFKLELARFMRRHQDGKEAVVRMAGR